MMALTHSQVLRTVPFLIAVCLLAVPAQAKYSGGSGTAQDPYQIATGADLIALGETPADYDKHFILTADIDLDPNLPGRKVFDKAVIAPAEGVPIWSYLAPEGVPFGGVLDGRGHTISHLTIKGDDFVGLFGNVAPEAHVMNVGVVDVNIAGSGYGDAGGLVGINFGSITNSYSTGAVSGTWSVGGLVGYNAGTIAASCGTGAVSGIWPVGGLVGYNHGTIAASYSTGAVSGASGIVDPYIGGVGGLVGHNSGTIAASYSTGAVSGGTEYVGGLVGNNGFGEMATSFWDIQTSGQTASAGGTGKTTAEMQTVETFLRAGWDFVDEVANGTHDYWQISPGDYPRLRYQGGNGPLMPEGQGTAEQPYLIRDARDLGTVWFEPLAYYRLAQSIDLSGITWSMAVIPWFGGSFDGSGHVISNLHIRGHSYLGLLGYLDSTASVSNVGLEAVDVNGTGCVGGLAGDNHGAIAASYSSGSVNGIDAGGLVGSNSGSIGASYSRGSVSGGMDAGGLAGYNSGTIAASYSTGAVSGIWLVFVGGLVGGQSRGGILHSFWDMETSGASASGGGVGKTTAEMQTAKTFLDAGWDFVGETANGTEDLWWIDEGRDYPRLWWEAAER